MNMMNFMLIFYLMDFMLLFLIFIPSNLYKFHPLIFSMILFFYTIIITIKLNYYMMNYMFSYILFLIMIGGLMILIMYFTSISSNELINYSKLYIYYFLKKMFFLFIFITFYMIMLYQNFFKNFFKNFDMMNFDNIYLDKLNYFMLKNMYMDLNMDLTIFFLLYLLLMMMFSTMICMKYKIPMRQLIY